MRRLAAIVLAVSIGLAVSGCRSPIQATGLDAAMRTTFTHLYSLNQNQRDLPVDEAALHTRATCLRTNGSPRSGPGDDWVCNIVWRTPQATTAGATYSVTVRADGCFTADGDGPVDLVGSPTLVDAQGKTVMNPLWAFDGCLPLE
jgi:hypothetical protein